MTDVAEEEALVGAVDDEPDIEIAADRPEVLVLGLVEAVELQAGVGRIELKVEGRGLGGLLLVAGEFGEALGECVGDAEVHMSDGASSTNPVPVIVRLSDFRKRPCSALLASR